jgi:transposase
MRAYSEDLRKKVVEAVKRGMKKCEAAYTFGLSLSSVKRYVGAACEGRSLRPKKRPGMRPKIDNNGRRLLEADLQERPAATLSQRREFLERVAEIRVSVSAISRVLKRSYKSQTTKRPELQFRALVTEDGPEVELVVAW